MLMFKTFSTRLAIVLAVGSLAAACGDNWHGGGGGPIDASHDGGNIDGGPDAMIDGGGNTATVSATLAVTDVALVDPSTATLGGVSGGSIAITFSDLTDTASGGVVLAGQANPVNGCLVTEFNAANPPHGLLDVGTFSITDDATSTGGLLKTVGPCNDLPGAGYTCISCAGLGCTAPTTGDGVIAQDLSAATGAPLVAYAFAVLGAPPVPDATTDPALDSQLLVGSALDVSGFTHTEYNGTFPIIKQLRESTNGVCDMVGSHTCTAGTDRVGQACATSLDCDGPSTLIVLNTAGAGVATEGNATANFAVINGASPIPTLGVANTDFIGTGTVDITHATCANSSNPADPNCVDSWPAFTQHVDAPGQGWSLGDFGASPTAWPFATAADQVFGCGTGTITATGAARASNVVTITTSAAHHLAVGNNVTISNVTDSSFNGTFVVASTPSATTFTYAQTGTDATSGTGSASGCGDGSTALVQAMIVSGKATKQSLAGLQPFQMPTEVPGTDDWIEWQCAFLGQKKATMPQAAVQAINDFGPTRVEVRVIEAAGAILQSGPGNINQLNLLVGHAYVGHTTAP